MQVALLTAHACAGDATGNQVAEKLAFFLDRGADVRVFAESRQRLHPLVRPYCRTLDPLQPAGADWDFLTAADLVIAEYGQAYALLELLPLLAGGRPRILLDYHGVTPPDLWGTHNREVLDYAVRQRGLVWCADAAVAHSRFTRRELLEATDFPPGGCVVLPHPVDLEHFSPGEPERSLGEQLGLPDATFLLFVGRLAPNKRVPILVEALDRLRAWAPPVHAVVVGDTDDLYEIERCRCQDRAVELGVADRLHFLGRVSDERLRDAYRSAHVLVMPSVHEGFCLPVMEALACGLPVVAARAGALPETVGSAGLTFTPDDPDDLARQLRRVWNERPPETRKAADPRSLGGPDPGRFRIAVVAYRYGTDFAGGAEASLRTMAEALHQAGHQVEVFTTCTRTEHAWTNDRPEGTEVLAGIPVHRFSIDPHDSEQYQEAARLIAQANGAVAEEVERQLLAHSLHSRRLLEALKERPLPDAIITGPYLTGLSADVARAFPDRTLLVPCFHNEPLARLRTWPQAYGPIGGVLYHSPEEQALAEAELGLNSPGACCLGTWLDTDSQGNPQRGRERVGTVQPYLLYCGRYLPEKGLPVLLDYARRYAEQRPGRFTLALMGQGSLALPKVPWLRDLGFVDEAAKRDVLAGAAALVNLSPHEALSLAALEAWAQGVPVLADARCDVLAGHLERGGGGRAVDSYDAFAAALDDLWERPREWHARGLRGQEDVRTQYGSQKAFTERLEQAIRGLSVPLPDRLRRRGQERAAGFAQPRWRERFANLVETLLDQPPRPRREQIEVRPRSDRRTVPAGGGQVLVPVRVSSSGTMAALATGPARVVLRSRVVDAAGQICGAAGADCPLPDLLMPEKDLAVAVPVAVPARPGTYQVLFSAARQQGPGLPELVFDGPEPLHLEVADAAPEAAGWCTPLLAAVQAALAEAHRLQQLPDDYTDVTQGRFASWKAWIKRKLLGNFKRAYVDVLSRQQSAFNRRLLLAIQDLAECCATLDSLSRQPPPAPGDEIQCRLRSLEERLAQLEDKAKGKRRAAGEQA